MSSIFNQNNYFRHPLSIVWILQGHIFRRFFPTIMANLFR